MKHEHNCSVCDSGEIEQCKELDTDIRKLQDKIGNALNYYLELEERYGHMGGWEMVEDRLVQAIGWAELPLEPIPQED